MTSYDLARIRSHFPSLVDGAAHFDGPGGTQTPDVVGHAVAETLTGPLSNRGTLNRAELNAEEAVVGARAAMADLTGGDPRGVVLGRSMTQLTMDTARTMAKDWAPGDEVVVTRLDHDANVRPWVIAAEAVGASARFVDFDPATGELDPGAVAAALTDRTQVVAVTAASNLIGTRPDLSAIAAAVHGSGALLYVDGVHHAAHAFVDVEAMAADVYVCSPYKFLGPHCGVLVARPELLERLHPDKLLPATDQVPERFELGTLPYELMAGITAAVDFLADLAPGSATTRRERLRASYAALEAHEDRLRLRIEEHLRGLPGATLHSRAAQRTPTLLVTFAGVDLEALSTFVADRGVNAPAGSFYAYEASRHLGLGEAGGLRLGLAPYTDDGDVDRLLDALDAWFSGHRAP